MDVFDDLRELQRSIHKDNVERGFWEEGAKRNQGESVALIVSELSEALEAHRKDRIASKILSPDSSALGWLGDYKDDEKFKSAFIGTVKDTVEDEIADTVIRILDYTEGHGIFLLDRIYRKESTGNFAHDILILQDYCIKAFNHEVGKDWGYVLRAIITFCEWYKIDLLNHVLWKLRYNRTRPYKHGKNY